MYEMRPRKRILDQKSCSSGSFNINKLRPPKKTYEIRLSQDWNSAVSILMIAVTLFPTLY